MTSENPPVLEGTFNYDHYQRLRKEVVELRALCLSLAAQLEMKSAANKNPTKPKED